MWVFGYGSLIWNPGFDPVETVLANCAGYRRGFFMRSIHHRGSEAEPGLVLALDQSNEHVCQGVALRIPDDQVDQVWADLRERELISAAYTEVMVDLALADGRLVRALAYVVDRDHWQYCGALSLDEQAGIIARAVGERGPNTEYLYNTAAVLQELGIQDAELDQLVSDVQSIAGPKE